MYAYCSREKFLSDFLSAGKLLVGNNPPTLGYECSAGLWRQRKFSTSIRSSQTDRPARTERTGRRVKR